MTARLFDAFAGMVVIPAGGFMMGSPADEPGRLPNEGLRRHATVVRPFALACRAVTVREFAAFIAETGPPPIGDCQIWTGTDWAQSDGHFACSPLQQLPDHPAVLVSWHDAQRYVAWQSQRTGLAFYLPSEVEWEYAARAGSATAYPWGDAFDPAFAHARTVAKGEPYCGGPVSATSATPNAYGLHHMLGNVWEWVADAAPSDTAHAPYHAPSVDRVGGDEPDEKRVVRGGSWLNGPAGVRSARRHAIHPTARRADIGFRVACALPERK